MTSDNSDWLRHFLQAGLYQEQQLQDHPQESRLQGPPQDTPKSSSPYHRDIVFGDPSLYQALMSMTNNNPSEYFQHYEHHGPVVSPERAQQVAATQRDRWTQSAPHFPHPPPAFQRAPMPAAVAPSSLLKTSQASRTMSSPALQQPNRQAHSALQLPHSVSALQRPAMPASVESSERQTLSQPPRDFSASANRRPDNLPRSAPKPKLPTLGRPPKARPSDPINAPQPSRTPSASTNRRMDNQTRPGQHNLPLRRPSLESAHSAGQTPSQPPKAPSTDQHRNNHTHSAPAPRPAPPVSTLKRPTMGPPSGRPNSSQPSMASPSLAQQDRDGQGHATKKRRMEDGSSEARSTPEWQPSRSAGPQLNPVAPQQPNAVTRGNLSAFSYASPNQNSLRYRADIVSPFNKLEALEKTEYNPETIARDVLIASGRHPTEGALNLHLLRLLDHFGGVTMVSDLTTFRWDLVEAAARDSRAVASSPRQQLPQQPPSLPGPTPQLKPLNSIGRPSWLGKPHSLQPPANWANPSRPIAPQPTQPQPPPVTIPKPALTDNRPKHASKANPPGRAPAASTPKQSPAINIPKRTPPINLTKRTPAASPPMQPSATRIPSQTPSSNTPQRVVAVSIPKQKAAADTPKHATAVSIPSAKRGSKMVGKKQSMVEVSVPTMSVSYPVFACKWKGCQAKLHNLEVLKQHLMKVHIPHNILCGWTECQHGEPLAAAKLYEHVMSQHVEPIAWKLGDGPAARPTGESASDDYVLQI